MRVAGLEKLRVQAENFVVDPGLFPLGAGQHHPPEIRIGDDPEPVGADGLREPPRHDEPIQREYPALPRLDPVEIARVAVFRHREDADGIGSKEKVGSQLEGSRTGSHGD